MLVEGGIDVSYETIRRWALKFGTIIARRLRRGRPRPDGRWNLDEVFVCINGRQFYIWRAVDSEGEVLDILVQPRRGRRPGNSESAAAASNGASKTETIHAPKRTGRNNPIPASARGAWAASGPERSGNR